MPPLNNFQKTCLALAVGASLSQPLQAATITVNSALDSGGGCTLRSAIESSNRSRSIGSCTAGVPFVSDDIVIAETVSLINLSNELPIIEQDVTITGQGAGPVVIDANQHGSVLAIQNSIVEITNLTLTGGSDRGISSSSSKITLKDSNLISNFAEFGGALRLFGGEMIIDNSTLSQNFTTGGFQGGYGGAIHMQSDLIKSPSLTITDSVISDNSANTGGVISMVNGGLINISGSTFSNNRANSSDFGVGGVILAFGGPKINIDDSVFSENSARSNGGVMNISGGSLSISNSSFTNNRANSFDSGLGGVIYARNSSTTIINSTLSGNSATYGGGLNFYRGTATITNSTLSANSAAENGGGVYSNQSDLTITNSTLFANSAMYAGGIQVNEGTASITNNTLTGNSAVSGGGLVTAATTMSLSNNIIAGNLASDAALNQWYEVADIFGASTITSRNNLFGSSAVSNAEAFAFIPSNSDIIATSDGLNIPLSQILSPLANNGGPTLTHALPSSSPAINAGSNAICPSADQRGVARNDGLCDIGAYEVEIPTTFYVIPLANGGTVVIEL